MNILGGWLLPRWRTVAIFVCLAPILFMLIDMASEQFSQTAGLSPGRLWSWIAEDGFFLPRAVYALGIIPAFVAGTLIARRDSKGGAKPGFVLAVTATIGVAVGATLARNLFLFTPPPFLEQLMISSRATTSVVLAGFVCYGLTRMMKRPKSREKR